ncbi:hypothetical protein G3N59_25315 [Paraburkholderia sp. Ac-20340]|uniref:hypothetical protein n=1 Tax=Paraburkholderia sp. Ac-20340 TaxID=2703888 RepID=UPI0019807BB3|nr:hypothetical protein [Paraburkholderia sp. Ac-20340]MBN3856705.1 hypothetical protein [Paraburkholderia sp. Ac-20340]
MDPLNTRPSWLAALLPLLAVWQYGDRGTVRGELYRMALSADAAAQSADALRRIATMLDRDGNPTEMHREELLTIVHAALADFERVPPCAPVAMLMEPRGNLH